MRLTDAGDAAERGKARKRCFLKKEAKTLTRLSPTSRRRPRKSFLVLFSKKEPLAVLAVALALCAGTPAHADFGQTLARVRARGVLDCGVAEGQAGFSQRANDGSWHGLDVDFCRAVAAATLGNGNRVRFIPLPAAFRFPALQLGQIDILSRTTTWTTEREASFGVVFAGVIYFDEQKVLVRRDGPAAKPDGLNGARVCVVEGTNLPGALQTFAAAHGWHVTLVRKGLRQDAVQALVTGACDAYTSDYADLRQAQGEAGKDFIVRGDDITREPLSPVVRWDDGQWIVIVRGVHAALINAEARGLTQALAGGAGPVRQAFLADTAGFGRALGIDTAWALNSIQAVGNYGEIFDHDLGAGSDLKLDRGRNRLWTDGGMIWAPPLQ